MTGNINAKELCCAGKVNGDLEITRRHHPGGEGADQRRPGDGHSGGGQGAVIRGGVEIKAFSGTAKQEPKQEPKQEHKQEHKAQLTAIM